MIEDRSADGGPADRKIGGVQDAPNALEDADPRERALDELVRYLAAAGVGLDDLATVEAALEAPAPVPVEARQQHPGRARRRGARSHEGEAAIFEAAGVDLRGERLQVVVSEDRLSATIRRIDGACELRNVATALKYEKVRHGIMVDAIKAAVARARRGEVVEDIPVARGEPARPGRDAHFEWAIDVAGHAGTILEDGSIDLRDRRLTAMVEEGELLGRLVPARPGASGRDVTGRALVAAPAAALVVVLGANVRAEEEQEGVVAYYATAEGGVTHAEDVERGRRRLRLGLTSVSRIERDVDYATGHVDFEGDVVIDGTVKALFRVQATGTVSIGGNVEAGARVTAGGDVLVSGGVVGADTELKAGGKVMAKFLQSCKVYAAGDVEIGAYIFQASVRCQGSLTVAGLGEGNGRALVGGLVWAAQGIETPSLGSVSNPRIRLVVGVDPERVGEAEELRQRLRSLEEEEHQLLKDLDVERFDAARIKAVLRRTTDPAQRADQVQRVQRLTRLRETRNHARKRLEEIAEAQREQANRASLTVTGTAFAGPQLRLGEHVLRIAAEVRGVRYRLVEEDGETSIQQQEA